MILTQEAKDLKFSKKRIGSILSSLSRNEFIVLIVEPTSKCNLKCSFCTMHNGELDVDDQKMDMSDETFELLLAALNDLHYKIPSIQLHGYGEPLMHKKIVQMARNLRPYCDSLRLITNGIPLTKNIHEKLIAAGVDEIHISLDVANKYDYRRVKEKNMFDRVVRNIKEILPHYERCDGQLYIKVALPEKDWNNFWGEKSVTKENFDEAFDFVKRWAENKKNVHLKVMPLFSTYKTHPNFKDEKPCEMPFYMVKIKADGFLDGCCAAIFNELSLGHIRQGLNVHERAKKQRLAHLSGHVSSSIPLCGSCAAKTAVDLSPYKAELEMLI